MDQPAPASSPEELPPHAVVSETPVAAPAPEGLPEDDPLTPEILEDEAIRGDFVLRWVVVALAILLGCSQLNDALPLVHARAGEWLAANGVLPKGHDPLSLSTTDRVWIQLDWLFDLLAAGLYAAAGGIGLSLAAGALAAGIFTLVVQAHRHNIRTWWTAVCAALALLASYDRFDFAPPAFTLLGIALVLAIFVHVENSGQFRRLWCLVPLMVVWAQLSPQAWIGAAMIALYGIGVTLDRPRIGDQPTTMIPPQFVLAPAAASVLIMLVHPFTWHTWESAWKQYAVEYPAWRMIYPRPVIIDLVWYPLWSNLVWTQWTHRLVAGVTLAVIAGLCLLLNRRRATWAHTLLYLGGNALGMAALHDLPAASLINAVIAGIHAQEWYYGRFGQVYTVAWAEVAFSRGGRAITLLAFFALAWTIISGRIDGPDGRRTGVGLSRALQVELDTYHRIQDVTFDERGFHTTVRQGDFLIAAGRKSVVDRRVLLFVGEGDADLLSWFERVRRGFLPVASAEEVAEQPSLRREAMERFQLSHVAFRLLQPRDDASLPVLLAATDWSLTEILPTAAVFHQVSLTDLERKKYAAEHVFNPVPAGLRPKTAALDEPGPRPILPTWSQLLISTPRQQRSSSTALAQHYLFLGRLANRAPWSFQMGCYHLAVRSARAGIREDALQAEPYRILGEAYVAMSQLEAIVVAETGVPWVRSMRYLEAVSALQQAVSLQADAVEPRVLLIQLYQQNGQAEAALSALREFLEVTSLPADASDEAIRQRQIMVDLQVRLEERIEQVRIEIDRMREAQPDALSLAVFAQQNGCVEMAITLLQNDAITLERNPLARQLLTLWLAELGKGVALDESSDRLAAVSQQLPGWSWRSPLAYAALSRGDYGAAIQQWQDVSGDVDRIGVQSLLETTPLTQSSPVFLGDFQYPVAHLAAAQQSLLRMPYEGVEACLHAGCCEMERGNHQAAVRAIRTALQHAPDTPLRPLLRLYLYCLTDELIDYEPPSDWIPQPADLFAPESAPQ